MFASASAAHTQTKHACTRMSIGENIRAGGGGAVAKARWWHMRDLAGCVSLCALLCAPWPNSRLMEIPIGNFSIHFGQCKHKQRAKENNHSQSQSQKNALDGFMLCAMSFCCSLSLILGQPIGGQCCPAQSSSRIRRPYCRRGPDPVGKRTHSTRTLMIV